MKKEKKEYFSSHVFFGGRESVPESFLFFVFVIDQCLFLFRIVFCFRIEINKFGTGNEVKHTHTHKHTHLHYCIID